MEPDRSEILLASLGKQDPAPCVTDFLASMTLNAEQWEAACSDPELPAMISAGAGTGKTKTIIAKIAVLTKIKGVPPAEILALTYTKKAATELKDRLAALGADRVETLTTHAFCMGILRKHSTLVGVY